MTVAAVPIATMATAPGRAVGRLAVRQLRRGAIIVAVICAGMSAGVAVQYRSMFRGSIDGSGLRALAENPAVRVLFGPPVALDDPGGFTVWRTGTPLLLLASVWILLAATRITRGEEDAGRVDLLLAGRLRMLNVVLRSLRALTGCALLISMATGAGLVLAGTAPAGAIVYAAAFLGVTLAFATVGVLAAQIMPTRSAAVGATVAALSVSLLLRMLADGVPLLAWSAWTTPFGLTARAAPYADNRVAPLLVLAAMPVVVAAVALVTVRHRDVGSGLVAVPSSRAPRTRLLRSVSGFAVRRAIPPTVGWAVGIAAYFLLVGALLASILGFLGDNPRFADLAATGGFTGLGSATGFAAVLFEVLAVPTGLYAATRLATLVADEKARRWTALFSAPRSRTRLVCTEIAVTAAGVVVLHTIAGAAMWLGAAITGAPLAIGAALAGALNTTPIAWLGVTAAALAVGWLPQAVAAVGALPVAGGFLLDIVALSTHAPQWVVDLSPFAHLHAVPYEMPDWAAISALTVIGSILLAVGVAGYSRRDLTT
jgi:ABC-2 type transport system permease protein